MKPFSGRLPRWLISRLFPAQLRLLVVFISSALVACGLLPGAGRDTVSFDPVDGARILTEDFALYGYPVWSSDGGSIAALRIPSFGNAPGPISVGDVVLINLESGDQRVLDLGPDLKSGLAGPPLFWMPSGNELAFYYFDPASAQQMPSLIVTDVPSNEYRVVEVCRCTPVALDAEGSQLLVVSERSEVAFSLSWFDLETKEMRPEMTVPREKPGDHDYIDLALSPDGASLLLGHLDGGVYRYEMGSGKSPELFLSPAASPAWSADGSKVAFAQLPKASFADYYFGQLVIANADGSFPTPLFPERQQWGMLAPAWSPDGTQIAFLYQHGAANANSLLVTNVPENLRPLSLGQSPSGP